MKVFKTIYNIRILLIGIGICCFCATAQADSISSQRFTLTMQNQALSEVFQTLSNESGIQILYSDALGSQRINLDLESATLESALQKILARQNHTIVYDRNGSIQIDVYDAGTSERIRSANPVTRKPPQPATRLMHRSSKHPGLKLSQKLLEKSAPRPEEEEIDQTALIKHHQTKKEMPSQAKVLFNIMSSGSQKPSPPMAKPK